MSNFSAFKLFYDNFLYRNNVMIQYDIINKYLNKIIETLKIATTIYHDDAKLYIDNLTKYQSIIKDQLDKIMDEYPYFFEKYYELYNRYTKTNNTVADMPFVISCSFYNDYGRENINEDYVQRFTSLEKKRFRERAKKMSFIEYYKEALKDFDTDAYDTLINLLDSFINTNIRVNLSFEDNKNVYIKDIKKIMLTNSRVLEKAKLNDDYNILKEKMELVYKGCFKDIDRNLERELSDYLLFIYEDKRKYNSDFYDSILTNDLNYGLYKDFVSKEKKYKEKYEKIFASRKIVVPNRVSIAPGFRSKLISIYYDDIFILECSTKVNKLIEKINGIKSLAWDIEDIIWEYILFKASHSSYLKRNNTVRYAIINSLYKLYNPKDLLNKYETIRKELVDFLENNKDLSAKIELKMKDFDKLLSKKDIIQNIYNRRKEFILEKGMDNIASKTRDYDTRDYDLYVIAETLTVEDLLVLFKELSKNKKIESKDLIEYICQCILLIKNPNYSLDNINYELIGDVSRTYLNLEYEINLDDDIYLNKRDQFNVLYDSYLSTSSFNKLKGEYKL